MDKYIGLDMHLKTTTACVYEAKTGVRRFETLESEVGCLRRWLRKEKRQGGKVYVTFEVGGHAGHYYDELVGEVDELTVCNPSRMPWIYRTGKKNDRLDAEKLSLLMAIDQLPAVHMPKPEVREWRALIGHRRKLVEDRTRCKNRIRAHLRSRGVKKAHRSHLWSVANRTWMRETGEKEPTVWGLTLLNLLEQMEVSERQIERVTERLDKIGAGDARVQLLETIPGVGPRTAEAVVAYMDGAERFENSKKFAAYCGMTPRLDESGDTRRLGHVDKKGPSVVRWLVVESCWRLIRWSPGMKQFFDRVQHGQAGRKKVAVVATARKLLTVMHAMLRNGEEYNEELVYRSIDKGE
jgi:transposase